jgi:hypothetical protein
MWASKTIRYLFLLVGVAYSAIILATAANYTGIRPLYVSEFFTLLGVIAGAGTVRNIVTDGVMPAWKETRLPASITGDER